MFVPKIEISNETAAGSTKSDCLPPLLLPCLFSLQFRAFNHNFQANLEHGREHINAKRLFLFSEILTAPK